MVHLLIKQMPRRLDSNAHLLFDQHKVEDIKEEVIVTDAFLPDIF